MEGGEDGGLCWADPSVRSGGYVCEQRDWPTELADAKRDLARILAAGAPQDAGSAPGEATKPEPDHVIAALAAAVRGSYLMDDPQEADTLRALVVRARQQWDVARKALRAAAAAPQGSAPEAAPEPVWVRAEDGDPDGTLLAAEHRGCHMFVWEQQGDEGDDADWKAAFTDTPGGPEWTRGGYDDQAAAQRAVVSIVDSLAPGYDVGAKHGAPGAPHGGPAGPTMAMVPVVERWPGCIGIPLPPNAYATPFGWCWPEDRSSPPCVVLHLRALAGLPLLIPAASPPSPGGRTPNELEAGLIRTVAQDTARMEAIGKAIDDRLAVLKSGDTSLHGGEVKTLVGLRRILTKQLPDPAPPGDQGGEGGAA